MAKTQAKTRRAAADDGTAAESKDTLKTYRVRPGNSLTLGEQGDDGNVMVTYGPGEEIEMSVADAEARPWCVEAVDTKKERPGQTSRLKKQVADLQKQIKELTSKQEAAGKDDPGRKDAIASLIARGDNFIGRGEPEVGKVPPDVVDAHEAGLLQAEVGAASRSLADEVGMKGLERGGGGEQTGAGTTGGTPPAGSHPSTPANLKPGESVKPGDSKPADTK
jgi:hypothetical protein